MFYISVLLLLSLVLYKILCTFLARRQHAAEAFRLGCKPPRVLRNKIPFGLDLLRRSLKALREQRLPPEIAARMKKMHANTFAYSVLGFSPRFTTEPRNIQAMLATQFHEFSIGGRRQQALMPLVGKGVFTNEGRAWEHSRALVRPHFKRAEISDLDLEERHLQNLLKALPIASAGWTTDIDLQPLFFHLTLDTAMDFLCGESLESQLMHLPNAKLSGPLHEKSKEAFELVKAIDTGLDYLSRRLRLPGLHWLVNSREFRSSCRLIHKRVDHFVRVTLSKPSNSFKGLTGDLPDSKPTFLDSLAGKTQDPIELRYELLHILGAGRDTTASLLAWVFYILARHPDIHRKLRATILNDFGSFSTPNNISFETLKSCNFLQYSISETLRLFPIVPVNSRKALKDTTLPLGGGLDGLSPIFIPKGTIVDYNMYVMHRREDLWGADADEFRPERWIGKKHGWDFLPFGGGPRICVGRTLSPFPFRICTNRVVDSNSLV